MSDTIPTPYEISAATAESLGGTTHDRTGLPFIAQGAKATTSPSLFVQLTRQVRLLMDLLDLPGRAVRSTGGNRHIGVYPFDVPYPDGSSHRFEGDSGYELTGGDGTYKVYIDRSTTTPALAHGSSWPASKDDYLPVAEYVVSSGAITTDDLEADLRSLALFAGFDTGAAISGISGSTFTVDNDATVDGDRTLALQRTAALTAALVWAQASGLLELYEDTGTSTLAKLNLLELHVSGTKLLDSDGAAKVAAAVAGDALVEDDGVLDVNVDDSTIEIDSNTLQVKDGGISAAKLASGLKAKLLQVSVPNGSGAGSATVTLQIQDLAGGNVSEAVYLEVGVFDDVDGETEATNAVITDGGAGDFLDAISAGKRTRAVTDASGQLAVTVTSGVAATAYLRVGMTSGSRMLDCSDYGTVTIS